MYYYNYAIIPETIVSFLCIVYTLYDFRSTDNDPSLKKKHFFSLISCCFTI